MRVDRAIDRYLRHVAVDRGLSEHTVAAYRRDLGRYASWLAKNGVGEVQDVSPDVLAAYLTDLARDDLAVSSVARAQSSVKGLHRFLALEGMTEHDPGVRLRPPKLPRRLPKALTVEHVERLLDGSGPAPEENDRVAADDPVRIRDRALLEMLYASGARVSELVMLDVDDVVVTEPDGQVVVSDIVRVRGKGDKERIVPLGSFARAALSAYLTRVRPELARKGRSSARLFLGVRGAPLSRQSVWLIIRAAGERAGLEVRDLSPHTLRHSFATHLMQGGADVRVVQELLGHASVATTQIYTKVTIESLHEVYRTTHPRAQLADRK